MDHLMLLHGALGSEQSMLPLAECLQQHFHCHTFSFQGHGEGPSADGFSIKVFASQMALVAQSIAAGENLYVFGYSMGGYVALYAHVHLSLPLAGIITLGTKWAWTLDSAAREAAMLQPEKMADKLPAFAQSLALLHGQPQWMEVVRQTASMMLDMGKQPPLTNEDYSRVQIPVHLLLGEHDKMVSREETAMVLSCLPNGSMAILPNTPHPLDKADISMLADAITKTVKHFKENNEGLLA